MMIADCPGCMAGDHDRHVEHWGVRPEGVIDGEFCYCKGDCAERAQAAFDKFFGNMADIFSEDALTPSARTRLAAQLVRDHVLGETGERVADFLTARADRIARTTGGDR